MVAATTPEASDNREASILVVDGDGVSRRFVELALTRNGRFAVESAANVSSALDILRVSRFDLVISEGELPDGDGLDFYRRVSRDHPSRQMPFLFLAADADVSRKVAALEAGAVDFLKKPCAAAELHSRVAGFLVRQRQLMDARRRRNYLLAGDFAALPFADLVAILEVGRRTGILDVFSAHAAALIHFEDGRVVHAAMGNLVGPPAFYEIMELAAEGRFEFTLERAEATQTISASVTGLLMEGARRHDERERNAPRAPRRRSMSGPVLIAEPTMVAATDSDPGLAKQLQRDLTDEFSLGELHIMNHGEVAEWCQSPDARARFHVQVFADVETGAPAFTALAAGPSEREIMSALTPVPKLLVLAFRMRKSRLLDVVLVDPDELGALDKVLVRAPSAVVLAPPDGDALAIDAGTRLRIDAHCKRSLPRALVGIGSAALEPLIADLAVVRTGATAWTCLRGVLGSEKASLRHALLAGIRLWAERRS